ncbi:MAG TPA: MBL fold metallo-hydrolase [Polyangiaceae bacterium]|nr:MBL fold metallo-hydrolase [Polyangiaceae bacterium]
MTPRAKAFAALLAAGAAACAAPPPRAALAPAGDAGLAAPAAPPAAEAAAPGPPAPPADGPHVPDTVSTRARAATQLARGVYVIRHEDAPDTFPQSNTLVVSGEREALAVDSTYLPSSAKKDIAQIRTWTKLPVRYLVNTHWHYDHTMGNGAYRDAFPGLSIVSHVETQKQIAGYNPQWFAKFPERAAAFEKRIEAGKSEGGRPYTEGEIAELKAALAGVEPVWAEFRELAARRDLVPTLAFDRELRFDLGGREVRVLHLGRGNTAGDAVVYLPREKILAAGDLLDHPVPYLGGGYPVELLATLEGLARLDVDTIVPGHGAVLHGKAYLGQVTAFLREVIGAVDAEIHRQGNGPRKLEEVRKAVEQRVDVAAWRQRFAGDDREARDFFDGFSFSGLVTAAYAELWPR